MSQATITIDIDHHLHTASTKALVAEINRRHLDDTDADLILELEREVIAWANDGELIDGLEDRGFKVSRNKDNDDWYEITLRDWCDLSRLVATGDKRDALDLIEWLSNGFISAICELNRARLNVSTKQGQHP